MITNVKVQVMVVEKNYKERFRECLKAQMLMTVWLFNVRKIKFIDVMPWFRGKSLYDGCALLRSFRFDGSAVASSEIDKNGGDFYGCRCFCYHQCYPSLLSSRAAETKIFLGKLGAYYIEIMALSYLSDDYSMCLLPMRLPYCFNTCILSTYASFTIADSKFLLPNRLKFFRGKL